MKTFSIPLRPRSGKSDYTCADGEVAMTENLQVANFSSDSNFDSVSGSGSQDDPLENNGSFAGTSVKPFKLSLPPAPEVEFALKRRVLDGWNIHPDTFPSLVMEKGEATEAGWGRKAMQLLSRFEKDVKRRNLFFEPFFVMSALRLKDGSRVVPSPPVLMIPNSGAPIVAGTDNFAVETMKMDIVAAVCGLQWRIRVPEELKCNEDVAFMDILVSEPVPMYSRKGEPTGCHREECLNFTHSIGSDGCSAERRVATERIVQGWLPESSSAADIMKAMLESVDFYAVSRVALAELTSSEEFGDVDFNCGGLAMISAHRPYRPDFMHLSDVSAAGSGMISGRMTVWDMTVVAPLPLPLCRSAAYVSDERYNPRWVFHPDPAATAFRYTAGDEVREVPLTHHPGLYGSYYWGGLEGEVSAETVVPETQPVDSRTVRIPGGVWRSVKENTLLFHDSLLMRLDVRRVISMCRAFRASGLVATTSPTVYAFTTDGVFLLKEMDDGTFRDAGLICSYVLRDAGSYVVKGRSVEFVTTEGDVMTIDGTTVKNKSASGSGDTVSCLSSGIAFGPIDATGICRLTTRPLKLGDAESWKRVWSVRLRGDLDPGRCRMALYGSADLRNWKKIAEKTGSAIAGMWAPCCRFYKIEAEFYLSGSETIQGFVFSFSLT